MNTEYAKVILDSIAPHGKRITTMEVKYWRAIHSEVMTHRMFSRNAASSRAIPFNNQVRCDNCTNAGVMGRSSCPKCGGSEKMLNPKSTVGMLRWDGFIPEYIGFEQKGMQSGEQLDAGDILRAQDLIEQMLFRNIEDCKKLATMKVHKSIINRYLEPWSYITVVITATEWENFFNLRCHPAAEKHLQKIAYLMKDAMSASVPQRLIQGDWHLPYIQPGDDIEELLLNYPDATQGEIMSKMIYISTARCARVSYLTQDGIRSTDEDLKLYSRLRNPGDGVMHASPFEHAATPADEANRRSGNFRGWIQHRKTIPGESGER